MKKEFETNKKQIVICVGLPGSGKTTFSKEYLEEHPNALRFNNDDIYKCIYNGKYQHCVYFVLRDMIEAFIDSAVDNAFDCIIDNTHMNPEVFINTINTCLSCIKENSMVSNYEVIIKDFTGVPLETCLERNSKREKPIPEKHIIKMNENMGEVKEIIKTIHLMNSPENPVIIVKYPNHE